MKFKKALLLGLFIIIILSVKHTFGEQKDNYPHPVTNPESPIMLTGKCVPENKYKIDILSLPPIHSEHLIKSQPF
jgi:hypothetical protein